VLYHFLYALESELGFFNVFRYITFRAALAAVTAILLSFLVGPWMIRRLQELQVGQEIRDEGPESHHEKRGTPTMGGLLIITAIVVPTLLWADLSSGYTWAIVAATLAFGAIGFLDDYLKISQRQNLGLRVHTKFSLQILVGLGLGAGLLVAADRDMLRIVGADGTLLKTTELSLPFFKNFTPDLGVGYLAFVVLVIVGAANAVNLTDGLDGLAIGAVGVASTTFAFLAYAAGHARFASYLGIPFVSGSGELAVFCAAMVGASLGFLWFNCHPAEIFMGDVGSMALGGALGTIAVLTKMEMLLVLVGGLFVVEALSVILQVGSFRLRGRRIFRMAPLHHHFELGGWSEPKVVIRFWILSILFALTSLASLKLR